MAQKRWSESEPLLAKALIVENQSDRATRAMLAFNSAFSVQNRNRFKKGMKKAKVIGRMARMGGFKIQNAMAAPAEGEAGATAEEGEEQPEQGEEEAAAAEVEAAPVEELPQIKKKMVNPFDLIAHAAKQKLPPVAEEPLARGEADQCYCPGTLKAQSTYGKVCDECGCVIKPNLAKKEEKKSMWGIVKADIEEKKEEKKNKTREDDEDLTDDAKVKFLEMMTQNSAQPNGLLRKKMKALKAKQEADAKADEDTAARKQDVEDSTIGPRTLT